MTAERVPLEDHLGTLTADRRAMWDRFAALVAEAGPSERVVTRSRIAFRAHRIFAGASFQGERLEVFFDLPRPVPEDERDGRFRAVRQPGPGLWTHRLSIARVAELDRRLGAWLRASWAAYSLPPGEGREVAAARR